MRVLLVLFTQSILSTLTDDEDIFEGSGEMRMIGEKSLKVIKKLFDLTCHHKFAFSKTSKKSQVFCLQL